MFIAINHSRLGANKIAVIVDNIAENNLSFVSILEIIDTVAKGIMYNKVSDLLIVSKYKKFTKLKQINDG